MTTYHLGADGSTRLQIALRSVLPQIQLSREILAADELESFEEIVEIAVRGGRNHASGAGQSGRPVLTIVS